MKVLYSEESTRWVTIECDTTLTIEQVTIEQVKAYIADHGWDGVEILDASIDEVKGDHNHEST